MRHVAQLAALLVIAAQAAPAQVLPPRIVTARNATYLELLGAGGWYSVNYERRARRAVAWRLGATAWTVTNLVGEREGASALLGGLSAFYEVDELIAREPGWMIEGGVLAIGGSHSLSVYQTRYFSGRFLSLVPSAGVRRQRADGGLLFRASFMKPVPIVGGAARFPRCCRDVDVGLSLGYVY